MLPSPRQAASREVLRRVPDLLLLRSSVATRRLAGLESWLGTPRTRLLAVVARSPELLLLPGRQVGMLHSSPCVRCA